MNMMSMDCPRCGFSQPKDQFCANCGLDVDRHLARPKPFLVRLTQDPKLYYTALALVLLVIVGFITYSQRELVTREVRTLLDLPLLSKEAGDPNSVVPAEAVSELGETGDEDLTGEPEAEAEIVEEKAFIEEEEKPVVAAKNKDSLEIVFLEIPRETLFSFLQVADKLAEGTLGRVYIFNKAERIADSIQKAGKKLSEPKAYVIAASPNFILETPPTASEAFQFGLLLQMTKWTGTSGQLRWDANLILPQPENVAVTRAGLQNVIESSLTGQTPITAESVLVITIEPQHRAPASDFVNKAGLGPWAVFKSEPYRLGENEWIALIHAK